MTAILHLITTGLLAASVIMLSLAQISHSRALGHLHDAVRRIEEARRDQADTSLTAAPTVRRWLAGPPIGKLAGQDLIHVVEVAYHSPWRSDEPSLNDAAPGSWARDPEQSESVLLLRDLLDRLCKLEDRLSERPAGPVFCVAGNLPCCTLCGAGVVHGGDIRHESSPLRSGPEVAPSDVPAVSVGETTDIASAGVGAGAGGGVPLSPPAPSDPSRWPPLSV